MIDTEHAPPILSRLENVRRNGAGWSACCPAHEDRTASLSVSFGDDDRTLLHCHAGCETASVLRAVGLVLADLMPTNGNAPSKPRIDQAYDYRDEQAALLFQAVRMVPKDFRQRAPNPDGGWTWKTAGIRRVLYRLPELLGADPADSVYICEGEKDADRLAAFGPVSTTNVGGAGKWRPEYSEHLRGRHVVILPDNDQPGREHAQQVAKSLKGIAASVKILELPGLPAKGDVSNWLDAGGTLEKLAVLVETAPQPKLNGEHGIGKQPARASVQSARLKLRDPAGRTDVSNAERFKAMHGESVRYVPPWGKWLAWDGRRWAPDAEMRIDAMAKQVAAEVWREAGAILPDVEGVPAREILSFAKTTAGAKGIANMITLAKSEPGVPVLPNVLDCDPWAFNCQNGVIDLKTGRLRPHDRSSMITRLCPTEYITGAAGECPQWEQTVDRIFGGNLAMAGFVQRLLGSALVGEVVEHILPIFWGDGSNGKGLLLETILDVLGPDFACKIASEVLLASKSDRHPTELADLHGKRLVVASETDDGRRLRESLLKEITGGDTIKARRMREDFWQFKPSHTLLLITNHRPTVRGTDHGVWRRLCLVPFTQTFWDADRGETGPPELQADKHLREKLRGEHAGVFRWLVDGCLAWQARGVQEPSEVKAATSEYRVSQDVLGAFFADCCILDAQFTSKASDVRKRYVAWSEANGERPLNTRRFGDALTDRDVTRRTSNGVWYEGLGLVD